MWKDEAMRQLIECGGVRVGDWYLNENGQVKLDYPASISDVAGVLVIANSDEIFYIGATTHYGPRIRDFIHSINGGTTKARIHRLIAGYLATGKTDLVLWRKDDPDPHVAKAELRSLFCSKWNG